MILSLSLFLCSIACIDFSSFFCVGKTNGKRVWGRQFEGYSYRNIHHLEPVGVSDQIVGQDDGALQSRVGPFRAIGICNVELGDGDGLDLVGLLGHEALDSVFVVVVEDGGHVGGGAAGERSLRRREAARSRGGGRGERWEMAGKQRQKSSSRSDYCSVALAAWKEGEGLDEMVA